MHHGRVLREGNSKSNTLSSFALHHLYPRGPLALKLVCGLQRMWNHGFTEAFDPSRLFYNHLQLTKVREVGSCGKKPPKDFPERARHQHISDEAKRKKRKKTRLCLPTFVSFGFLGFRNRASSIFPNAYTQLQFPLDFLDGKVGFADATPY